jgi:molecular chaperone GrpE
MTERKHKTQPTDATISSSMLELEKRLKELETQLESQSAKASEYFDGWQRERADFVNYKKRVERDQAQSQQNAVGNVARKYLPVVDDLERALKARPTEGEGARWAEGVELIYKKLQGILDSEGIKEIKADGESFDPSIHEALTNEESPAHESGQIIEVVQKGYLIGDRVLRPALVRVAR